MKPEDLRAIAADIRYPGTDVVLALRMAADEIDRLRAALEWYANEDNYDEGSGYERGVSDVTSDGGYRATEALNVT